LEEAKNVRLGQKQTLALQKGMSALPLKADTCSATARVRYGPIADIGTLFDHLVGARSYVGLPTFKFGVRSFSFDLN
jgi:hypothetical protein